jgi:hypothetical protein
VCVLYVNGTPCGGKLAVVSDSNINICVRLICMILAMILVLWLHDENVWKMSILSMAEISGSLQFGGRDDNDSSIS